MKIVIPGGTGHLGHLLARAFAGEGHEVVVLSRTARTARSGSAGMGCARVVRWDGHTVEDVWAGEIDGADAVVNLAGRSVNCRYTAANLREMLDSRVDSTHAVGGGHRASSEPATGVAANEHCDHLRPPLR